VTKQLNSALVKMGEKRKLTNYFGVTSGHGMFPFPFSIVSFIKAKIRLSASPLNHDKESHSSDFLLHDHA